MNSFKDYFISNNSLNIFKGNLFEQAKTNRQMSFLINTKYDVAMPQNHGLDDAAIAAADSIDIKGHEDFITKKQTMKTFESIGHQANSRAIVADIGSMKELVRLGHDVSGRVDGNNLTSQQIVDSLEYAAKNETRIDELIALAGARTPAQEAELTALWDGFVQKTGIAALDIADKDVFFGSLRDRPRAKVLPASLRRKAGTQAAGIKKGKKPSEVTDFTKVKQLNQPTERVQKKKQSRKKKNK